MKHSILFIGALALMMASCTKSNLKPVSELDQEITYQTVVGSAKTKAATAMNTSMTFKSWAFQHDIEAASLPTDKVHGSATWNPATKSATWIDGADISFADGAWRAATKYYWPKISYLTFFALAPSTATCGAISCAKDAGISFPTYSVVANKNTDLLVAEVAYNQTKNTHAYGSWALGVPTVFHHQLSSFKFTAQTVDPANTSNGIDFGTDLEFYVTGIAFEKVATTGAYSQIGTAIWTPAAATDNFTMFTNASGIKATSTPAELTPAASDYTILLPQTLTDADDVCIRITYTIKEKIGSETITKAGEIKTAKLASLFTANWESEKQYTLNIKFTRDEILWDPAIEEAWISGTTNPMLINN